MKDGYVYDAFISWTGKNAQEKNTVKNALEARGLKCYDSAVECAGNFRDSFCEALAQSKTYVLILSDKLLNDPNSSGEGYFSEVRRELETACNLEARGRLNFAVFCVSPYFLFNELPDPSDITAYFYYSRLNMFSFEFSFETETHAAAAENLARHVHDFVSARDGGKPLPSVNVKLPIIRQSPEMFRTDNFSGREDELHQIDEAFAAGARIVALTGIGGIGKTELAKRYVGSDDCAYFCPQRITLGDDDEPEYELRNIISRTQFDNKYNLEMRNAGSYEQYRRKIELLGSLDENILLIIDNYNNIREKNIEAMLKHLRCKIILTTRITDIGVDKVKEIEVKRLPMTDAYHVFATTLKEEPAKEIPPEFEEIYKLIDGHSLTLCIIAKMMIRQGLSLPRITQKLRGGQFEEKVDYGHNAELKADQAKINTNQTLIGHLRTLFDLSGILSKEGAEFDKKREILKNLATINLGGVKESSFKNAMGLRTSDELIELAQSGWIERKRLGSEDFLLFMHPLCSLLIITELKPAPADTRGLIDYVLKWADTDSIVDYAKIGRMEHRVRHMIDAFGKNGHFCHELNIKYADILYRLGEAGKAAEVLKNESARLQAAPVENAIAIAATLEKVSMIQFECGLDKKDSFAFGTRAIDIFYEKRDLRACMLALGLSQYAVYLNKKDVAVALQKKAFEVSLFHKEPLTLASGAILLSVSTSNKSYIRRAFKVIRQNKNPENNGICFYAEQLLTYGKLIASESDTIKILSKLHGKLSLAEIWHFILIGIRLRRVAKRYKGKIEPTDPFFQVHESLYKTFHITAKDIEEAEEADEEVDEDALMLKAMSGALEIVEGLSAYMKSKGMHTMAHDQIIKMTGRILFAIDKESADGFLQKRYKGLAAAGDTDINYEYLNKWQSIATEMFEAGKYDEAICAFGNVYAVWNRLYPQSHFKKAETLSYIAAAFYRKQQYGVALDYHRKTIAMLNDVMPRSSLMYDSCLAVARMPDAPSKIQIGNEEALKYIDFCLDYKQREGLAKDSVYLELCLKKARLIPHDAAVVMLNNMLTEIISGKTGKDKRLYFVMFEAYDFLKNGDKAIYYYTKFKKDDRNERFIFYRNIARLLKKYYKPESAGAITDRYLKALKIGFEDGKLNQNELSALVREISYTIGRAHSRSECFDIIKPLFGKSEFLEAKSKMSAILRELRTANPSLSEQTIAHGFAIELARTLVHNIKADVQDGATGTIARICANIIEYCQRPTSGYFDRMQSNIDWWQKNAK